MSNSITDMMKGVPSNIGSPGQISNLTPPGLDQARGVQGYKIELKKLPPRFGHSTGYYQYSNSSRQWGTPKTIRALVQICRRFRAKGIGTISQPMANIKPIVGIGDISFKKGGLMKPHKTHQTGLDIDIRPCRTDPAWQPVDIHSPFYDQENTKLLIKIFIRHPNVKHILFNDPKILKISPKISSCDGHDNHFHVTMKE